MEQKHDYTGEKGQIVIAPLDMVATIALNHHVKRVAEDLAC